MKCTYKKAIPKSHNQGGCLFFGQSVLRSTDGALVVPTMMQWTYSNKMIGLISLESIHD